MTNQEAIKQLQKIKSDYGDSYLKKYSEAQKDVEALNVAIRALEESNTCWIVDDTGYFHCPKCGIKPRDQVAMTDYCPNCGADLRGENK